VWKIRLKVFALTKKCGTGVLLTIALYFGSALLDFIVLLLLLHKSFVYIKIY